jgi:hypothetical protein
MHIICDECFKKAGPIEELTIGTLLVTPQPCAYCGKEYPAKENHRLRGDTPDFNICRKLGISTSRCSYFDFIDQQRDLDEEFEAELAKDPKAMARRAVEWLKGQNTYGQKRIARIIETLLKE